MSKLRTSLTTVTFDISKKKKKTPRTFESTIDKNFQEKFQSSHFRFRGGLGFWKSGGTDLHAIKWLLLERYPSQAEVIKGCKIEGPLYAVIHGSVKDLSLWTSLILCYGSSIFQPAPLWQWQMRRRKLMKTSCVLQVCPYNFSILFAYRGIQRPSKCRKPNSLKYVRQGKIIIIILLYHWLCISEWSFCSKWGYFLNNKNTWLNYVMAR